MDRLIYVAMSAAQQTKLADDVVVNNLANASTTGFHADISSFKSLYLNGAGVSDRAYNVAEGGAIDLKPGPMSATGRSLDIGIKDNGWLSVTNETGEKGYVKSASLHVNANGILVTQKGQVVNSVGGEPITVPAGADVSIDHNGAISITDNGVTSVVSELKVDNLPPKHVKKMPNGLINVDDEGRPLVKRSAGTVISGVLEQSNVSPIDALVKMIDLSKNYETNINMLSAAKKDNQAANQLLTER